MRKGRPKPRKRMPDPKFGNERVTRFVNDLMLDGKKSKAFSIFYDALEIIEKRKKDKEKTALEIWQEALENVTPAVEVKSRRIGGATFQVPVEVRPDRKISLSHKFIIKFARQRSGKSMAEKLAAEILAAYNKEGGAYKKKEDMHRMAEANKAFSHFKL
jgi:small subunit ribosomal protein S7